MLKVHVLADNVVNSRGLLGEHGLSLLIQKDNKNILFDTGQSSVFIHNANIMNLSLDKINYIILSHGHYDHCGGIKYFPFTEECQAVFIHPDAFAKKYSKTGKKGVLREIGVPVEIVQDRSLRERIVFTGHPFVIEKGIMLSGEVPRSNDYETASKKFLVEKDGKLVQDNILDEQFLVVEEEDGIAVFLGCSHPGVINSLTYAQKLYPGKRIKLLVGGMHLENAGATRLQLTIQHITALGIEKVVPLHCTGFEAAYNFKHYLGHHCAIHSVGETIET